MVQSRAATPDDYVAEAGGGRAPALTRIREIAREALPGYVETMQYGMIAWQRDGVSEIALASQKQHVAIYFMGGDIFERNAEAMAGLDHGKGCLRFRNAEAIDDGIVRRLMADRAAQPPGGC